MTKTTSDAAKIAQLLQSMAQEADSASRYASGMADGLLAAAMMLDPAEGGANDNLPPPTRHRPKITPTQRPVIDALKQNGAMTVTQVMAWARTQGHDLLRPTVYDVLTRLTKRGLVATKGSHYELIPPES